MRELWIRRLALAATALALLVIVLGAFVRLSDAGLGCPDWPTCYGRAAWPTQPHHIDEANERHPERPVEVPKAWKEQVHRHLAATLGTLVLLLALGATWSDRRLRSVVAVAAVAAAAGTVLYISGRSAPEGWQRQLAEWLSVIAVGLPVLASIFSAAAARARVATFLFGLIVFQAMLGMWTVTWLLKPIVVMGHLMGGLSVFALLVWILLRSGDRQTAAVSSPLRGALVFGLVLLAIQIALGGWTSANYAALSCGTSFPTCLNQWWPRMDFSEAFVLWRGIGVDYEGGILDGMARSAIQVVHRIGALVVFVYFCWLLAVLWRERALRSATAMLALLLGVQITLGIANVKLGLPLAVATAHNGVAALLISCMVYLLYRTRKA